MEKNPQLCKHALSHRSHKRIHKCHSQPSVSLRTGGTLPPHHLRVLFITVWQHVSSSPRHYATPHWYSPTVQQPGMQHNHGKNMTQEDKLPLHLLACARKRVGTHVNLFIYFYNVWKQHATSRATVVTWICWHSIIQSCIKGPIFFFFWSRQYRVDILHIFSTLRHVLSFFHCMR